MAKRAKKAKKILKKKDLGPATVVYVGEEKTAEVRITIIDYNENEYQKKEVKKVEECFTFRDKDSITWINIDGVHDTHIIENIGKCFGIHPLILENIGDTTQRPKVEDFEDYLFIVIKMLYYYGDNGELVSEQVSLIQGKNFVISFQETKGDVFDPVRERIEKGRGRIRKMGSDYLLYRLTDAVVDNCFSVLEKMGDEIEILEKSIVEKVAPESLHTIYDFKKDLILLRRSIWPLRDVVNAFTREAPALISENTTIYFRDVYDHTIQVIDTVETYRDMLSGLHDTYLSSISNKMNEIMKVLTMFATIFIPLTFIVGVYGMNFSYLPELRWRWGYFAVWGIIVSVVVSQIFYFKRKKWF